MRTRGSGHLRYELRGASHRFAVWARSFVQRGQIGPGVARVSPGVGMEELELTCLGPSRQTVPVLRS